MGEKFKIGTRGSMLALWQANWVRSEIEKKNPSILVELEIIKTKGDKILDVPLAKVGGKGLFVKEIEEALLNGKIDLAVHSMKDMPAEIPEGLCIAAVPEREDPRDALITCNGGGLSSLGAGARIGTSSLRRAAQLLYARPEFEIVPLRGNLDTRLGKLENGNMDGIILASAGIKRLGLESRITEYLDTDIMLPAAGQGALCLESREGDSLTAALITVLEHVASRTAVMGERAFSRRLEGGCQVPIAAYGTVKDRSFSLCGLVADIDGKELIRESLDGPEDSAEDIGLELAERLLSKGAKRILDSVKDRY
jgi:hydroxymethylbilane synthase